MIKNHFDYVPQTIGKKRSVFPYWQSHSGSYEMGRLYPLDVIEISPGQSLKLDIAGLIRSGTLVNPLMDDIIVDISAFYVRNRISWNHWEQFLGSNDDVAFNQSNEYTKPYIPYYGVDDGTADGYSPAFGASEGTQLRDYCNTLACHFGLPVAHYQQEIAEGPSSFKFDAIWVRGYYRIWNEFWRDENSMSPVLFSVADSGTAGQGIGPDGITPVPMYTANVVEGRLNKHWQLGYCAKVRKLDDYFTSCLPSPVRADAAPTIPVSNVNDNVNVLASSSLHDMGSSLRFNSNQAGALNIAATGYVSSDQGYTATGTNSSVTYSNLYVNLHDASYISIAKFRDAILLNRLYENRLRIGGRYPELLQGEFGVHAALDDRAQLLIHKRFNINISEVVSTAQTDDSNGNTVNAVGELGGMSKTPIRGSLFTASFDEHGLVFILMCIRQRKHTYVQGWQKKFYRETWLDYYWPSLNGTSDVVVEKQELYAMFNGSSSNKAAFGYQEYGADEKVQLPRSVGMLNPELYGSLSGWNMADVYGPNAKMGTSTDVPQLNSHFLIETPDNFARDLIIEDMDLAPQFIGDFIIHGTNRKVMPVYNIPGVGGVL